MMFYIRVFLILFWLIICCIIGLGKAIFRWGDPSLGHYFGGLFSRGAQKIIGLSIEVQRQEYLEASQPCIYIGNHQSNFDLVIYGHIYPGKTVVIGKKELIWLPLFGILFLASGNIIIDRKKTAKAKDIFNQIVEEIKTRKVSVWVFPEGTRNKSGEGLLPFKKGAFHMAIAAQVPVVSFVSSSTLPIADWKRRKLPGGKMQIKILPPVSTIGLTEADVNNLANNVREKMLTALSEIHSESKGLSKKYPV